MFISKWRVSLGLLQKYYAHWFTCQLMSEQKLPSLQLGIFQLVPRQDVSFNIPLMVDILVWILKFSTHWCTVLLSIFFAVFCFPVDKASPEQINWTIQRNELYPNSYKQARVALFLIPFPMRKVISNSTWWGLSRPNLRRFDLSGPSIRCLVFLHG